MFIHYVTLQLFNPPSMKWLQFVVCCRLIVIDRNRIQNRQATQLNVRIKLHKIKDINPVTSMLAHLMSNIVGTNSVVCRWRRNSRRQRRWLWLIRATAGSEMSHDQRVMVAKRASHQLWSIYIIFKLADQGVGWLAWHTVFNLADQGLGWLAC